MLPPQVSIHELRHTRSCLSSNRNGIYGARRNGAEAPGSDACACASHTAKPYGDPF